MASMWGMSGMRGVTMERERRSSQQGAAPHLRHMPHSYGRTHSTTPPQHTPRPVDVSYCCSERGDCFFSDGEACSPPYRPNSKWTGMDGDVRLHGLGGAPGLPERSSRSIYRLAPNRLATPMGGASRSLALGSAGPGSPGCGQTVHSAQCPEKCESNSEPSMTVCSTCLLRSSTYTPGACSPVLVTSLMQTPSARSVLVAMWLT